MGAATSTSLAAPLMSSTLRLEDLTSTFSPAPANPTTETWTDVFLDALLTAAAANETTSPNASTRPPAVATTTDPTRRQLYLYGPSSMIVFCVVSVVINITVLLVSIWIKRPLSPTLHISLSLAGADACTSLLLGIGLLFNSYLPNVHDVNTHKCVVMTIEVLRLSGVIITVAHLLALAVNHYLGIIKPLHYVSIMTHRNTTICIILMWVVPILFFVIYFSVIEGQGFQSPGCEVIEFLKEQKLRMTYASLFFCPLILMTFIYTHIFVIVRRHQRGRLLFSQGCHYIRENGSSYSRSPHQQRDLSMSIKAIKTTLLILGSFIIGWLPAVLGYCLVCKDCLVYPEMLGDTVTVFSFYYFVNFLVILKTMINPIIYAARMHEIKKATAIMKARLCRRCCCLLLTSENDLDATFALSSGYSLHGHHRLSQYTDTTSNPQRSNTIVCRLRSTPYQTNIANGSIRSKQLTRSSTRSHQRRRTDLTLV